MSTIEQVMSSGIKTVAPTTTVREAAARMAELDVGSMPVCEGERLVGIVTDRDIAVRVVAKGGDGSTPVSQAMTREIHSVRPDHTVEQSMKLMADLQVRRLPVVDAAGKLVGIVSLGDLAVRQTKPLDETLEKISEPSDAEKGAN